MTYRCPVNHWVEIPYDLPMSGKSLGGKFPMTYRCPVNHWVEIPPDLPMSGKSWVEIPPYLLVFGESLSGNSP